jgi:type II secretory pathway component PulC
MATDKSRLIPFGVSTLSGIVIGAVTLFAINASLLRIPDVPQSAGPRAGRPLNAQPSAPVERDYKPLMERNLFRAKLQVEIPKPKTEKEIEEEALTAAVKEMALKGVMMGVGKTDTYAVIDLGGQKGVWTYEAGEVVEKGLALKEIRKDSVKLEKGDFGVVLKLFSPVYERTPGTLVAAPINQQPQKGGKLQKGALDLEKELKGIRKVGSVTIIPKSLAEKLKQNNNAVMSSIAVKAADDGLKVVAVDQGSIAQRIGISADDTLQDINGHQLNASEDINKVYDALKDATSFEVNLLRRGQPETLRYEIR